MPQTTRTLIKGGTVVTAVDTYLADVAIVDDKIAAIFGPGAAPPGPWDVTIDATGKYVLPGGIDAHTHMDMPFGGTTSSDDFETGTRAAAYGGTTTHRRLRDPDEGRPAAQGPRRVARARPRARRAIDYAFHMIMTDVNERTHRRRWGRS